VETPIRRRILLHAAQSHTGLSHHYGHEGEQSLETNDVCVLAACVGQERVQIPWHALFSRIRAPLYWFYCTSPGDRDYKHVALHLKEKDAATHSPYHHLSPMPIYTARLLKGNQRPSPQFREKGLDTLTPSSAGDCEVRGFPHKKQIAFDAYVQNLSAFLFATQNRAKVSVNAPGFVVTIPLDDCLSIGYPPLGVTFERKRTRDQIAAYDQEYGCRVIQNSGQEIIIFDKPTPSLAKKIREDGALATARVPNGVSSLAGLQAWMFVWKIVTLFWYADKTFVDYPLMEM
jgi:hypothetical protein